MNNDLVTVRNLATGEVGRVRRSLAIHPYFGQGLEIVPDGTKKFVPFAELIGKPVEIESSEEEADQEKDSE